MSLRVIHIFFIIAAESLSSFFGVWSIQKYLELKEPTHLISALGAFVSSVGLLFYLFWFIKKSKNAKP